MQIPEYVKRELSEVYLLMDHIAGRKDKTLDAALASNDWRASDYSGGALRGCVAADRPEPREDSGARPYREG
jgi:hypothetical protein